VPTGDLYSPTARPGVLSAPRRIGVTSITAGQQQSPRTRRVVNWTRLAGRAPRGERSLRRPRCFARWKPVESRTRRERGGKAGNAALGEKDKAPETVAISGACVGCGGWI
jgi:hypothetical protein